MFTHVLLSVSGVVGLFASVSDVDGELLRIIVFWTTLKGFGIIIKAYN
jgi:phage shock protein PspC (stress-responsive transcriptional regulator)